jgi:hypothetical protein
MDEGTLLVYCCPSIFSPTSPLPKLKVQFIPVLRIQIHMFLGLQDPDPDPLVRGMDSDLDLDPDPSIIMQK